MDVDRDRLCHRALSQPGSDRRTRGNRQERETSEIDPLVLDPDRVACMALRELIRRVSLDRTTPVERSIEAVEAAARAASGSLSGQVIMAANEWHNSSMSAESDQAFRDALARIAE